MTHLFTRRGLWLLPLVLLLSGCDLVLLNPSGDIAAQQGNLIIVSTLLMLIIIVPVIILTFVFAWRYRKGNTEAKYEPDWDHSTKLELLIWGAPLLIIIILGAITWVSTHKLDPYRPLDRIDASRPLPADHQPMTVQVVAMDWKWLFIYPEQGIATVNELVTPIDTPIRFKITASTVMNSFFIPAMAGQIYAMAGMETTLNAVMNKPGTYEGFSANYSGAGFSHMRFKYHAVSDEEFAAWVQKTKAENAESMDRTNYVELEKPSEREPVRRYGKLDAELFEAIVNRCVEPGTVCMKDMMAADANRLRVDVLARNLSKNEAAARLALINSEVCSSTPNLMKNEDARAY
ncbi:MAG: ubiquinol oxidase subunit II [Oxalicibacterium faecigallinarum]|uniref:ubiquinol oxidase subunit II n=1 Tax=Oxalicibacterium faecigallinarum TaxID=573741 RepID=UPI00166EE1E6|nr:ubiquinol oxidase subunit II [Oxalicibacterium faecigallinarum]MDQ7970409.1 ubiquinol oxidase subunit II [Oxalicibacterium faecigallinarum]